MNWKIKILLLVVEDDVKQFALTLSFYSPKAYLFLRMELYLPHPASLRKWMGSYKCNVGFLTEVIQYLKKKVCDKTFKKCGLNFRLNGYP